ncbi:MAG: hypothetical protein ACREPG_08450, partial [Candidatus Binatia bacterium]
TMTATLSTSTVDVTPPNTTITGGPLSVTNLTSAKFTFSSTGASSTFACKLDSAAFAACASPENYSGVTAGSHTFQVQATDASGNTDPTPASYNWTIDLTAPDTTITGGPSGTITTNSTSFSWSGADNVTTTTNLLYAYRLDPIEPSFSAFGSATSKSYSNLANTNYTFLVQAKDQAANVDASPASRPFTVSALTSITVVTPNGGDIWNINSRPTIQWSSSNVSGNVKIEISRNGGAWTSITSSTANDGAHTWRVNKPATTSARIRVCSVANPALCDVSNGTFTIQ